MRTEVTVIESSLSVVSATLCLTWIVCERFKFFLLLLERKAGVVRDVTWPHRLQGD